MSFHVVKFEEELSQILFILIGGLEDVLQYNFGVKGNLQRYLEDFPISTLQFYCFRQQTAHAAKNINLSIFMDHDLPGPKLT